MNDDESKKKIYSILQKYTTIKNEETVDKVFKGGMAILIIIMATAWIMLLDFAVRGHREIAIAREHQDTCDHIYLERDSARARLFEYLTTNKTIDNKSKMHTINNSIVLCVVVYMSTFLFTAWVVWNIAGEKYFFDIESSAIRKNTRCILYIFVVFTILSWMISASALENKGEKFYYKVHDKFENYDKLSRIDEEHMGKMYFHVWLAVIIFVFFVFSYRITCAHKYLRYLLILCATASTCIAAIAYYAPRLYNKALYDYDAIKQEFKTKYETDTYFAPEKNRICAAAKRNVLLVTGETMATCGNFSKVFAFSEHMKGNEFQEDVNDSIMNFRAFMSKVRNLNEGVKMMNSLSFYIMLISIILIITLCYPVFMEFMRWDHMVMNHNSMSWVMAGFFIIIIVSVFGAWMINALSNTNSDLTKL